ncbi:YkgB family protein [Pseudomonas protegens]|uniref:YkgB family protein n=1 Tax=Pseudomonas protegens TaxID=380021 RepID=UPI0038057297
MHAIAHSRWINTNFEVELMRWSLILIFLLFGYSKWFPYEAQGLIPIISNSPLLSWMHTLFGIQGASYALGVAEWSIGAGLILGIWCPRISLAAALGSTITYLTTTTLIISTPGGWEASAGGFPAMGGHTSFLVKDVVLLAGSIFLAKRALLQVSRNY